MKSAREIVENWYDGVCFCDESWIEFESQAKDLIVTVEHIQNDAFNEGLLKAISVIRSRLAPQKNKAFVTAIEEASVFLKAELERRINGEL